MAARPGLADISDVERGLALGEKKASPLLMSTQVPVAVIKAVDLREAAQNLGKIFLQLRKEDARLGDWALPSTRVGPTGERVRARQLDAPTKHVFGANAEPGIRYRRYYDYFETVMPEVQRNASRLAKGTLANHQKTLGVFQKEIGESAFAEWMHVAAQQILMTKAMLEKAATDAYRSQMRLPSYYSPDPSRFDPSWQALVEATESFIQGQRRLKEADDREAAAKKYDYVSPAPLRTRYVELLQVLRCARTYGDVVNAYGRSASEGTKVAGHLLAASNSAIGDFSNSLTANDVWQYPVLIINSVKNLNLDGIPGFRDFALAVAGVMGSKNPGALFGYASIGLMFLGLLSTGVGVGFILLDFALGGAGVVFSYMRERQHEMAASASVFLPSDQKLRTDYSYGETTLGAAFMIVAALGVLRGGRGSAAEGPSPPKEVPYQPPTAIGQRAKLNEPPALPQKKLDDLPPKGLSQGKGTTAIESPGSKAATQDQKALSGGPPKARERGGAGTKESTATEGGAPKPSQKQTLPPPPRAGVEPPLSPLKEPRRKTLEKELEKLTGRMKANQDFNASIDKRIRQLTARKTNAQKLGRTSEVRELEETIEDLKDQYLRGKIVEKELPDGTKVLKNPDADRYVELKALLRGTERDYYRALTNAARRRAAFRDAQDGPLHKMFRPLEKGTAEVDHLYPRNEIWGRTGFDELTWDQQVFLFAYRRNLMKLSATFNARRGVLPYRSVKRDVWGEFIDDAWRSPDAATGIDELSRLESAAAADIDAMIRNPKLIDFLNDNPQLSDDVVDSLIRNPGLVDALKKDPTAINRILQ